MIFKVKDLETNLSEYFDDYSFCVIIGADERNFKNRWRIRTTAGLCFLNKFYIVEIVIKSKLQ